MTLKLNLIIIAIIYKNKNVYKKNVNIANRKNNLKKLSAIYVPKIFIVIIVTIICVMSNRKKPHVFRIT